MEVFGFCGDGSDTVAAREEEKKTKWFCMVMVMYEFEKCIWE